MGKLYHKLPAEYRRLYNFQTRNRLMCLWLVHTQTFHEPAILLRSQCPRFAFFPRPLEAAAFQPFIQQHEAITFPVQSLDAVPASATEQKQRVGEWIQMELLLNKSSQAIYSSPQIRIAAGNIHPLCAGELTQHDFKIRNTVSTVATSAPEWTSASASAIRTVTATLPQRTDCAGVISAN